MGKIFEQSLPKSEQKLLDRMLWQWRVCASSMDTKGFDRREEFDHRSSELQGLAAAMGASGHAAPSDEEADKFTSGDLSAARKKGAADPKLKAISKKMYDYQQAYFKHAGMKELTLYRGVTGDEVDGAADGQKLAVQSRELSSFTADPNIAKKFGRVVEFKVPVERIFASSLVYPNIGSETYESSFKEAEFLVMGASDLEGSTIGKAIKRAADQSKPLEVPITDENADWLHPPKKSKGKKNATSKAAKRVMRRYDVTSCGRI